MKDSSGEQDIRRTGGLRKVLPGTYWTFLIGAAAISGVPFLSGFFSKDEILWKSYSGGHTLVWGVAAAASLMTAIYMFRLVFLTFHGWRATQADHGLAEAAHPRGGGGGQAVDSWSPGSSDPGTHAGHDSHGRGHGHGSHGGHLHDAPPAMAVVLILLAVGSVLAGYAGVPAGLGGGNHIGHVLAPSFGRGARRRR